MATPAMHGAISLSETGIHRGTLAFGGGPDGYVLIQRFSKINISLTFESIAK